MPSALWFVGGVLVGTLASCMLFLIVMGSHKIVELLSFRSKCNERRIV